MSDADHQLSELRRQAEKVLRARHGDPLKLPPERLPSLIHELEVHQIELEMQNAELLRSSMELETARDRYADLFDLAPVGYLILDTGGQILRINLTGAELLGIPRAQLYGKELFQFVAREHRDSLFRHLRQVFKNPTRESCELEMLLGDGSGFFAKLDSIIQPEVAGSNPQCLTLVSDISELKKALAVSRQARETAEKASQAKSHFLAAASHDLRQPLQAMTSINDLLKKKLHGEAALEQVNLLSQCLGSMNELFNALLDISHLESGSITPRIKDFPLAELLGRMDTIYRPLAERKGLSLRVVQSSASIRSDPVLLGQILDNLVSNAIRYTDTGKVLLGCRLRGAVLRIEVWDTGIGIPQDQHELIFGDFYQLGNPARDRSKGLGLGLATAARSARLLGGRIDLKSRENGSLFSLETPLVAFETAHEQPPASAAIEESTAPTISLLVVDDNNVVLYSLTHLLEGMGYKVTGAMSGPQALAKLQHGAGPFDFIITDYRLPQDETGIGLIKSVRQALGSEIPALIITGDLEVSKTQEVAASGLRVLHKPVLAEVLNRQIQEMLAFNQ